MIKCPRDATELIEGKEDGIEIDRCPTCDGAWYDYDELAMLEATVGNEDERRGMIDYAKRASELTCPACSTPMRAFNYRAYNLELDACSEGHGFWLDGGEAMLVREVMKERVAGLARSAAAEDAWANAKRGGGGVVDKIKGMFSGKK
jgi:Zn-finger nucleic acid-binding protein